MTRQGMTEGLSRIAPDELVRAARALMCDRPSVDRLAEGCRPP